jgi:hypothetical protein
MPTYFTNHASTPNTVAYAYTTGYANNPITSNVLVNVLEYPAKDLFYKIAGNGSIPSEIYN